MAASSENYHPFGTSGCAEGHALEMRLRTKFLLSIVLVISSLTCATLLAVRQTARMRAVQEVRRDALGTLHTFQVVQHEHQVALARRADLLATLAMLRNGDASTVNETGEDPWQSEDCDVIAVADTQGKIIALHSTIPRFPQDAAQWALQRSLAANETSGWWYSGSQLYQVALQPFYEGNDRSRRLGTAIVGRQVERVIGELTETPSGRIVFRHGQDFLGAALSPSAQAELAKQLREEPQIEKVRLDDEEFFAAAQNLTTGNEASIIVLKSYKESARYLAKLNWLLGGLGLIAVIGSGLLVFVLSDRFTRPLGALVQGVQALERGDASYPLPARGTDEVAKVTEAFDRMRRTLDRDAQQKQELETQLRQAHKMEALGRLAGGVAHDFNNILTVIKGHSDILSERLPATDSLRASAAQIEKSASRAASLTRQLLAFCRMQVLQPKIIDLNGLITDVFSLLKKLVREDITFSFEAGASLASVKADPSQIEQVLMNLTVNACDAMPKGGQLTIVTRNVKVGASFAQTQPPMKPGEYVLLSVTDTGQGMDSETKVRIFEPFFTTKEQGKGTGLGLATVYGIVKQSSGHIWVESAPGKGSRFEVYLPAVKAPQEQEQDSSVSDAGGRSRSSEVVLIVEDEDGVRELAREFLISAGYRVLSAKDGLEAVQLASNHQGRLDVLLTDVVMPKLRGPETAKELKRRCPELRTIYMSGYLEYNAKNEELSDEFFLQKPFSRSALIEKVREALAGAVSPALSRNSIDGTSI
jgi:signal transduction histidine kinase/CheY-like chemotaxis protein